jgi:hypothetical protein
LASLKENISSATSKITKTQVIIFVVMVIIFELIWAYLAIKPFNQAVPSPQVKTEIVNQSPSSLILSAPKTDVRVGEIIPVSINISSTKKTDGVDLIIRYDPNLLTVVPYKDLAPMQTSGIYGDYPVNKYDEKEGLITVSGVNSSSSGIVPKGLLGTILFKPKATGQAKIFLDFTKGETADSNITETQTSKDVLENVNNLEINITR